MNTRAVAELLGISTSTVQRWVKQLNLNMMRNELGHFIFSEEDIELLKEVQNKLQEGVLLQDISLEKPKRTGVIKENQYNHTEEFEEKIKSLQMSINQKADSVVTYQILQHRREIEELQEKISILTERLEHTEELVKKEREIAMSKENKGDEIKSPRKKRSFFKAIFG